MDSPLISIITVCFNTIETIEQTILSVINQTYPHIEYIIIDGGSTDGTVEIIKKYADRITYWVSEPDKGIYDAMNKGIIRATGSWLSFMNAGDRFANSNVLDFVFTKKLDSKIKVIYGNHIVDSNITTITVKSKKVSVFYKEMPFCHQAAFLKNENLYYDTNFRIAADYKLFRYIYKKYGANSFVKINEIVAIFDDSGISSTNKNLLRKEYNTLYKQFGGIYYYYDCFKLIIKKIFVR